ncbi:MAG: sugar ABC transporter ATP-binding protein [Eubacterium sp.]|nr:sugar ABC transporter ATP-binding protein [Eubacterium sp.]
MEYALEFKNISKQFPGTKALDKVHMKLRPGTVHALLGENGAGKSTLIKCLLGIYHMDEGEIYLDGERVIPRNVRQMHELGLSVIQQELSPVYQRSVMENIWLGREPMKGIFVDHKKMYHDTVALLNSFHLDIRPTDIMADLSVAQNQMIEIVKAVSFNSRVVMMDEPTSTLTNRETEQLFEIIGQLKKGGVSIIYVSHKMDEIFRIADEVTVFRDGKWIASHAINEITEASVISEMVGRKIDDEDVRANNKMTDEVVMRVKDLSDGKKFNHVSFELHRGEVLGLGGLVGAGRSEVLETIFGLRRRTAGEVEIGGIVRDIRSSSQAKAAGLALVTEERRKDGIFGCLNIMENMLAANYDKLTNRFGFFANRNGLEQTETYIRKLRIKTPSWRTKIENLSGGNQQKVLFSRWLLLQPDILLLDEPTRGIDVGAKTEIYQIISQLSSEGKSVIVVSSEMPELIKICDRVVVMSEGSVAGELKRNEMNQVSIMTLASKKTVEKEETKI